jgi:CheY-like chemotaxis protein
MLPRVIGEHIRTTARLSADLARVKADASQMEQVFVNLVLNSRDAMPMGGHLSIETANVELDVNRITAEGLTLQPGRYVMLTIADTGVGMDAETRARAFEPFFTTKPTGKGTGLGLATVYGIVDQSGGGIALETAPARGTSVKIYLPATDALAEAPKIEVGRTSISRGTETLLLVEDNDAVRDLTAKALRRRGYTVHEARHAEEALEWAGTSGVTPHLLVTDVIMPGLNGPSLAEKLLERHPSLRVLYMSGYTDDADAKMVQDTAINTTMLLQKPFTPGKLAEHVRLALDAKSDRA